MNGQVPKTSLEISDAFLVIIAIVEIFVSSEGYGQYFEKLKGSTL